MANEAGPALLADGVSVEGDAYLDGTFSGARTVKSAVILAGVHIKGHPVVDVGSVDRAWNGAKWAVDCEPVTGARPWN